MTSEPTIPTGRAPGRRRLAVAAAAFVLAAAAVGVWFWPRTPPPVPPTPDLEGADPEVVEAVAAARQRVEQEPTSARAWGRLGMVLRAHDFGTEAQRCFQEAERLDPQPYLQGLPLVLTDPAAGIACLERAVGRGGDSPALRLRLTEVLLEQGRLDEAQGQLDYLRERDPENRRTRVDLGRLALLRGQPQAALEQLVPCADDPQAAKLVHTLCAEAYSRLGQPERARAEQQKADQAPEDQGWSDPVVDEVMQLCRGVRFRLLNAASHFRGRRISEAIQLLQETVARYPQSTAARLQLGDTWLQLQQPKRAEQAFQEAVRVDPDSAEAWFRLGTVQALDRPREAAESFRRAIRLKPDHTLAHYNLGHRLKELGDPAGAAKEFRAALRCQPDYAPAQEALRALEPKGAQAPAAAP
jgi:tetratricopeptide (TPR) repeat protein